MGGRPTATPPAPLSRSPARHVRKTPWKQANQAHDRTVQDHRRHTRYRRADARARRPSEGRRPRARVGARAAKGQGPGGNRGGPAGERQRHLGGECRGCGRGQGGRRDRRFPGPAGARPQARRRHGGRGRCGAGAARPGRHRHGELDAAQRHDHRAGAGAARGGGSDLREPAQRHRRCRRAVPQGRQCVDPARRLRKPPVQPGDPRGAALRACGTPTCRRPPSAWCRPATALRSG